MRGLSWLRQPILITAAYVAVLYGLAVFLRADSEFLQAEGLRLGALAAGFLIPHVVVFLMFGAKPRLSNLVITFVILALLADLGGDALMMFLLGLVTALVKTFVRVKGQPIFNPAAAGLLVMAFFGLTTTWWGVSFAPRLPFFDMSVAMLLTLPIGLYLVVIYKKLPTLIGVSVGLLGVYFALTGKIPLRLMLEGTFAFFLFFMATEPKTTPLIDWQEWVYGVSLGGLLALLFVQKWVGSPYIAALLLMNVVFSGYKLIQLKMA